ncbi:MAG: biotin--[acetyl-CoA-carboxylase] ligase [Ilumatobacteraceae bacterium]
MTARADIWGETAWPAGWEVRHVAETGSTNTDLLSAVESGSAGHRSVLATSHQTAGRGRLDRRWEAPPGANLLVSIAFAPIPQPAVEATHRVGLAAVAAARRLLPDADVALKWPNDVLLDDVKLAGILAQRSSNSDTVVVGIGLNVGWAPDGAASLGAVAEPAEVLRLLLCALDDQPADIGPLYRASLATLGRSVRIEVPGPERHVEGTAVDVDGEGRLVVDSVAGVRRTFDVGDVVHVRANGSDAES